MSEQGTDKEDDGMITGQSADEECSTYLEGRTGMTKEEDGLVKKIAALSRPVTAESLAGALGTYLAWSEVDDDPVSIHALGVDDISPCAAVVVIRGRGLVCEFKAWAEQHGVDLAKPVRPDRIL